LSIGDAVNAGTVIIIGTNTYSGGTTLNFGTLVVGAQALGVGNVVLNGGILRANQRSINVLGNYTQHAGGTLQLGLGGSAAGQYDVLRVNGRAALGGTLQLFSLNGFQPKPGDIFTLGTAAGGLSGQFAQVLNPFPVPPRATFEFIYLPNSFVLELVPMPFALFALTPNELAVAKQLDKVRPDVREAKLIAFMDAEPTPNLPRDFEKISPDSLSALYEISFSAANVQASNLEERFAEIRSGSTGFSSTLNISNAPQAVQGKDGKVLIEPNKNVLAPSPENKWGQWIDGSGDYVKVNSDGNGQAYDFTTGGVSFGLDYLLTKNLAVGLAAGYAHTWTDLAGSGKIDADSGRGALYATYFQGGFYLSGYVGGGYNSYRTNRDTLRGTATGSTSGGEFDTYVSGGYEFHTGAFSFGPTAALQYTYVDISENTETGSLAPLRIVSKSADSLRTNLGVSASYAWTTGKVQVTPSVRASWQHEYLYSALPISAQFASGAGSVFTVYGPAEGHDSALVNVGVNVQWTPTIGTYFGYAGLLGRNRYDSQGGVCGVHWSF
jgi:outer membrane autotransporter protein